MRRVATFLCAAWLAGQASPALAVLPTVPTPPPAPAPGASSLLQAAFGLLVVLALVFGLARLARRFGLQRMVGSSAVKVVSSASLGARERVVVVEVAGTWLVLGVTPTQVNALHALPAQELPGAGNGMADDRLALAAGAFAGRLRDALGGKAGPR